jgi:O-acetyl-ADP-ribose deacetylase (regulator of RNase III)
MLNYILGDLLASDERIIAHGCNAKYGVFGSGIALVIKNQYPECYKLYRAEFEQFGLEMGSVITWHNWKHLLSDGTQYDVKQFNSQVNCDYDAVAKSIKITADYTKFLGYTSLGTCLIGCGLAGGDWSKVATILRDISEEVGVDINVYIIDPALYEKYKDV